MHPLHHRYHVDHLNLHQKQLRGIFYMDTLFSKVKSPSGSTCAQLITNGCFTRVFPMKSKVSSNIAAVLQKFINDVGIPETLVCDFATEQTGTHTDVMKLYNNQTSSYELRKKDMV